MDHKQKLKIVHIVDYLMPKLGYQEFLLPKWHVKHGHEVHIITSDRYRPIPNYEETWGELLGSRKCGTGINEIDGITIHRLKCLWEYKTRVWLLGLRKRIKELSPDVIFCHDTTTITAFRVANIIKRNGIPAFADSHHAYVAMNKSVIGRLYYKLLKQVSNILLTNSFYRFFGVTDESCEILEKEQGIPKHKIECLPLGIDTDLFRPKESAKERLRVIYKIPLGAKVVLQTGKLDKDKRPDWLAEAMIDIMKQNPDVWLVFVGAGTKDYLESIYSLINKQQLSDRLLIIPFVPASELADIYCMADICVYPSATSLSCLEAAACGKPVIMTDLPISRSRADSGIGICYETGNISDLHEKIKHLINNPEYMINLGKQAYISAYNSFSYNYIACILENLMYKAIEDIKIYKFKVYC